MLSSNALLANDVIELDNSSNAVFKASEWIGAGKKIRDRFAMPSHVARAYEDACAIPHSQRLALLPRDNITIAMLCERADTDLFELLERTVPHPQILQGMNQICAQQWLDGCQSICDRRSTGGGPTEYFPLAALGLWNELVQIHSAQHHWQESLEWLVNMLSSPVLSAESRLIFQTARDTLATLPWKTRVNVGGTTR